MNSYFLRSHHSLTGHLFLKRTRLSPCCFQAKRLRHQPAEHASFASEQLSLGYPERVFFPARPGQVYKDRYRVIAKLGYGRHSTVWLGRDEE